MCYTATANSAKQVAECFLYNIATLTPVGERKIAHKMLCYSNGLRKLRVFFRKQRCKNHKPNTGILGLF